MAKLRKIKNRTLRGKFAPDSSPAELKLKKRPRGVPFAKGNTLGKKYLPGQSGNPSGRPSCKTFLTAIKTAIQSERLPRPRTVVERLVAKWIAQGLDGNWGATAELANRVEGRPVSTVSLRDDGQLPQIIEALNSRHDQNSLVEGGEALLLTEGEAEPEQVEAQDGDLILEVEA